MKVLALAALGLALVGGVAAAASRADVTLAMRQYTNENKIRVFVWYGRVASAAAGEDVEVLGRDLSARRTSGCTRERGRSPGGGWEVESASTQAPYNIVDVNSGTTFRARWRDQLSNTILHKTPIPSFYAMKIPKRRAWKVTVNPTPLYMKLGGKPVVIQRFRGGKWERFRTAKLVHKPNYDYGGATNYEAVFETPTRGMRVRALLPTKAVAPCYLGKATEQWRT